MHTTQLLELPYDQRRTIVVEEDGALPRPSLYKQLGIAYAKNLLTPIHGYAAFYRIIKERQTTSARVTGNLLAITPSEAAQLRFPAGHPRRKVVYLGHP